MAARADSLEPSVATQCSYSTFIKTGFHPQVPMSYELLSEEEQKQ